MGKDHVYAALIGGAIEGVVVVALTGLTGHSVAVAAAIGAPAAILFTTAYFWGLHRGRSLPPHDRAALPGASGSVVGLRARPSEFFKTLDNRPWEGFDKLVTNAKRLRIVSRTAVNLLSQYEKQLERMCRSGCKLELLLVDPSSKASSFVYGSNPEIYRNNVNTSARNLVQLTRVAPNMVTVKVTKHAPTFGVIVVDREDPLQSVMQVQLYFLHGALGRDRPVFLVEKSDPWYSVFEQELDSLWQDKQNTVPWNASSYLSSIAYNPEVGMKKHSIDCPFCSPDVERAQFAESKSFRALYNIAPILPGHSLLVPKRHVQSLLALSKDEASELMSFGREMVSVLLATFGAKAFDWTIQEGVEAGQTLSHMHVHLIPREPNDLPEPGDWYPRLKEQESAVIDSGSRPHLDDEAIRKIAATIKARVDTARKTGKR